MTESDNATQNLSDSPDGLWSEIKELKDMASNMIGDVVPVEVYNTMTPEQKKITLNVAKTCTRYATALEIFQKEVIDVICSK